MKTKDRYTVDGSSDNGDYTGGGQIPPFVVFDIEAQCNVAGPFETKPEAEQVLAWGIKGMYAARKDNWWYSDPKECEAARLFNAAAMRGALKQVQEGGQWLIAYGNPVDGFNFIGPFNSEEDAIEYAERELTNQWSVAQLDKPE